MNRVAQEAVRAGRNQQVRKMKFSMQAYRNDEGFSDYEIVANSDLGKHLKSEFEKISGKLKQLGYGKVADGEVLLLPSNLYIIATMNTSDQSLFPIDSAFKRRWDWKYVPIENKEDQACKIDVDGKMYDWWQFLESVNDVIRQMTSSEDKQLGYFFCKAENGVISCDRFVGKVLFYLWNDVFKDTEFSGDVFNSVELDSPRISVNYVGYFFNKNKNDCVFILPKVIIDEDGKVFREFSPEELLNFEESEEYAKKRRFLQEFLVWIYRAISVYEKAYPERRIILKKEHASPAREIVATGGILQANCLAIPFGQYDKLNSNHRSIAMGLPSDEAIALLGKLGLKISYVLLHYNSAEKVRLRKVIGMPLLVHHAAGTKWEGDFVLETFKSHGKVANEIFLKFEIGHEDIQADFNSIVKCLPNKPDVRYRPFPFYLDVGLLHMKPVN